MKKHVKPFTYGPKIEAVRSGECKQTIRPLGNTPVEAGDEILFHGWEGRPYRSKWSWRKRVKVIDVFNLKFNDDCVINEHGFGCTWGSPTMNELARQDFIDCEGHSSEGEALKDVLKSIDGKNWTGWYQVIRW